MMSLRRIALFASAFSLALTSCNLYPGDAATTEELDVMITQYDLDADFSVMRTYAVSPTVTPISSDPNTPPNFSISTEMNNVIVSTIKANMAGYGWELVDSTDNPDMAIDLTASISRSTNIYNSYPGWGYPGYGYGWGWGYPVATSYDVATIYMNGLDINNVDTVEMVIPLLWVGLIQGPVIGNVDDPLSRVQRDVNVVFETSPYLNLN